MPEDASHSEITGLTCWVMSEGHAGMENQCLGLAEAVGLSPAVKRIHPRVPWSFLPARFWPFPFRAPAPGSDPLAPPWPDVLITCGRKSVALSMAIRRASSRRGGGRTFTVHIQDPTVDPRHFDLVIAPRHDDFTADNVILTRGALHMVTPQRLARDAAKFAPRYAHLPRPLVAVLLGGANRRYRVTPREMAEFAAKLERMQRATGAGLAVTPSRRTGEANLAALSKGLEGAAAEIWDATGENPYFGILGLADAIIVTSDSISMVSEACATGKPVHVADLKGGSERFRRFHETMRREGYTRLFTGELEQWTPPPLDDTASAAAAVREALLRRPDPRGFRRRHA